MPRTQGSRSASKLRGLTRTVRTERSCEQIVEFPGGSVLLDLPIPLVPVFFEHPLAELGEFGLRKLLDFGFEGLDSGHDAYPFAEAKILPQNGDLESPGRRPGLVEYLAA